MQIKQLVTILIVVLFISVPSAFALYVSCGAIDCDCKSIEAGVLSGGWRLQCRNTESAMKAKCEEVGYWTPAMGYCDPTVHGPKAFPLGKEFGTTSEEVRVAIISNRPWHLIYSLLPEYVSAEERKEGLKAFNKINTLFIHPLAALRGLYEATLTLRAEQLRNPNSSISRPVLVRLRKLFMDAANELKTYIEFSKGREAYILEIHNALPERVKAELSIRELTDYMIHMNFLGGDIFRALGEFNQIVLEGTKTESARIDIERLNRLITRVESLGNRSPFKESFGEKIYSVMIKILPEISYQIDYLWKNFKL